MKSKKIILSALAVSLSLCHSGSAQQLAWTNRTPGLINPLYVVAFGNGRFVASGSLGSILYSDARQDQAPDIKIQESLQITNPPTGNENHEIHDLIPDPFMEEIALT